MTDPVKRWLSMAFVAAVFGIGGGWAVAEYRLSRLEDAVNRIDRRVAEMYCGALPPSQQPGCR